MIENVSTQLTVFHCFAHCLLPGSAFASLYALLFLEKEAEIGGRVKVSLKILLSGIILKTFTYVYQETKIFQYCPCPEGQVTYNFHSSCKHMNVSFKSVCNKEHKGVICDMTSSSNSSKRTCPTGRVLLEELLVLTRFNW